MRKRRLTLSFLIVLVLSLEYSVCFAQHLPYREKKDSKLESVKNAVNIKKLKPELDYELPESKFSESQRIRFRAEGKSTVSAEIKRKTGKKEFLVQMNRLTKTPHRIIGGGLRLPEKYRSKIKDTVQSFGRKTDKQTKQLKGEQVLDGRTEIEKMTRGFIKENKDILQTNESDLKLVSVRKAQDKAYVTFKQYYRNLPVYASRLQVVIDEQGRVPSCGSDYHSNINLNIAPAISDAQAIETAKKDLEFDEAKDRIVRKELIILPLKDKDKYNYHLSYKLGISTSNGPGAWVYFIDAHTQEILVKYNDIKHETLSGNVSGLMLPERYDDNYQAVPFASEYINIQEAGVQATTDASGNYGFSLSPGAYSLQTSLQGPWVRVANDAGQNAVYEESISIPSYNNINFNWDVSKATLTEMNVFYHVVKIHDYVKDTLDYDGMDFQLPATVNLQNYGNAYWNPLDREIAFGDGDKQYQNFALFSDIIYHEYTHGVNDVIYEEGGVDLFYAGESGAIDEGLADYFACTINNNSILSEGFFGDERGLRDLNNNNSYPGDFVNQVHHDSLIFSGALWDMRKNLIELYGGDDSKAISDDLVHNARFGYPLDFSEYLTQILILDDNDEDLFNGTVHMDIIRNAFARHGVFPEAFVSITWPEKNSYIRGQIDITGVIGSFTPFFKNYELYCWKSGLTDKSAENGYLIASSAISNNIDGILGSWDTASLPDDVYCLGLKATTLDNRAYWYYWNYSHNVTIDNVDSPLKIKTEDECGFAGEKLEFSLEVYDIDDPAGPYAGSGIKYTGVKNLPQGAGFDYTSGVFSWTPGEADSNKIYPVTFSISDGNNIENQQKVNIYVGQLIDIGQVNPAGGLYKLSIYENKIVYVDKGDVYLYDLANGTKMPIAADPAIFEHQPDIYEDKVVWQEVDFTHSGSSVFLYNLSTGIKKWLVGSSYKHDPWDFLQFWPDIYKDKVVWQELRLPIFSPYLDLYMYDSSAEAVTLITEPSGVFLAADHAIHGDIIVWEDVFYSEENVVILMYDISQPGIYRVLTSGGTAIQPAVYGDKVVWTQFTDADDADGSIYLYNISQGKEMQISDSGCSPEIYENKVVWLNPLDAKDIWIYDVMTGTKMKISRKAEINFLGENTAIFKNKIVWREREGSEETSKIFAAILPELPSFNLSLPVGWSSVSLPIEPLDSNIESVLAPIAGKYDRVVSFTSEEGGLIYSPSLPKEVNTLKELHAGQGVSILMKEAVNLTIQGNPVGSEFPVLSDGWNFVGLTTLDNKPVSELIDLSQIITVYTIKPGSADTTSETNKLYYPAHFSSFEPGKGYWIKKDSTPPTIPVVTDQGAFTARKDYLYAKWSSGDKESGIAEYQYAIGKSKGGTDIVVWTSRGTAADVSKYGLSLQNGQIYYFSVKAKNNMGLWSEAGYSDGITLDITPPTGTIKINNDAAQTTSATVILNLTAADSGSGMGSGSQMKFSNDNTTWTTSEAYKSTKTWTLTSGPGTKKVYVKFKDVVGNWSQAYSDTINLL